MISRRGEVLIFLVVLTLCIIGMTYAFDRDDLDMNGLDDSLYDKMDQETMDRFEKRADNLRDRFRDKRGNPSIF
ncbi:unnamed protein product [Orchesella dallaii]|uniref:Uncharacterized protein n=1 Tax=Orchesella dallaii TaxID=48710 RepID=A0ABP1QKX7_9HEXA